jgi:hypothetical protein
MAAPAAAAAEPEECDGDKSGYKATVEEEAHFLQCHADMLRIFKGKPITAIERNTQLAARVNAEFSLKGPPARDGRQVYLLAASLNEGRPPDRPLLTRLQSAGIVCGIA